MIFQNYSKYFDVRTQRTLFDLFLCYFVLDIRIKVCICIVISGPNRLNLPNVLSRIIQYSRNQTLQEITDKRSASHNAVVLIISPIDQPSVDDLERGRVLMNSLRSTFFDIYFAYVAQDMSTFQNINNAYLDYSEMFLTVCICL